MAHALVLLSRHNQCVVFRNTRVSESQTNGASSDIRFADWARVAMCYFETVPHRFDDSFDKSQSSLQYFVASIRGNQTITAVSYW